MNACAASQETPSTGQLEPHSSKLAELPPITGYHGPCVTSYRPSRRPGLPASASPTARHPPLASWSSHQELPRRNLYELHPRNDRLDGRLRHLGRVQQLQGLSVVRTVVASLRQIPRHVLDRLVVHLNASQHLGVLEVEGKSAALARMSRNSGDL